MLPAVRAIEVKKLAPRELPEKRALVGHHHLNASVGMCGVARSCQEGREPVDRERDIERRNTQTRTLTHSEDMTEPIAKAKHPGSQSSELFAYMLKRLKANYCGDQCVCPVYRWCVLAVYTWGVSVTGVCVCVCV